MFFFKYSFNANTTHNCIFKMNIIALFLHILWDRKCKELLIPISEAETVVCFCFQMAPDSDLPTVRPERGSYTLIHARAHCVGVHTHGRRVPRQPTAHTHNTHTHGDSLIHASSLWHPQIHPTLKRTQLNHPYVQDHIKCITFKL